MVMGVSHVEEELWQLGRSVGSLQMEGLRRAYWALVLLLSPPYISPFVPCLCLLYTAPL